MIMIADADPLNPGAEDVGASLQRFGRLGFWLQVVTALLPLALGAYAFRFSALRGGVDAVSFVAVLALGVLLFTLVWFRLHVREGRRISAGGTWRRPDLLRRVWIGVVASVIGVGVSTLAILFETAYLFFQFLEAPQGGVPVIQTSADAGFVSAKDMLSLVALSATTFVESVVLAFGLILLSRVARSPAPTR